FGKTSGFLVTPEPFYRRRFRNQQLTRRSPPRLASFDQRNRTLTQIEGMASRHTAPPNQCNAQIRSFPSPRESRSSKNSESAQVGNALNSRGPAIPSKFRWLWTKRE